MQSFDRSIDIDRCDPANGKVLGEDGSVGGRTMIIEQVCKSVSPELTDTSCVLA